MNNLILRSTNSPYGDVNKGSVLSAYELDSNFISLKGEVIYTAESNTGIVTLKKYNGDSFSFAVSIDDITVTGGTYDDVTGIATFTNNTGGTFTVSGFYTGGNIQYIKYNDLVTQINDGLLIPGVFYEITDFQTAWDVPSFNIFGVANNYSQTLTGPVESIIVFATSETTIDSVAFQPAYPNDKIKYDYTFNYTEYNDNKAFGRITERIDEFGNRTDYDHRNIFFKRYSSFQKNAQLTGVITDYNTYLGIVKGYGTLFNSELTIGDVIILDSTIVMGVPVQLALKITNILDDNTLEVLVDSSVADDLTGLSLNFYNTNYTFDSSWKEFYVGQDNDGRWKYYYTFDFKYEIDNYGIVVSKNNYIGDYARYYDGHLGGETFKLANNVFGHDAIANTFGNLIKNNTIGAWSGVNRFGDNIYGNTIGDNCNKNIISEYFGLNTIGVEMTNNNIAHTTYGNTIGDYFGYNTIDNNFQDNIIGHNFKDNTLKERFAGNIIGDDFHENIFGYWVENNTFGSKIFGNVVGNHFINNKIGNEFQKNKTNAMVDGIITNNSFIYNDIKHEISGVDFTSATHVYNDYNCDILTDSTPNLILTYFSSGGQHITSPTA